MSSSIKYLLLITLFIYSLTSINFRGIEEYAWVPNLMGILLCFAFVLNLSKIKIEFNYPLLILFILVIWNLVSVFPHPDVFRYFITSLLIFILAFVAYNICVTYPEATEYIKWAFIISLFIFIAPGQSKEVQSYKEECELSIKQVKAIGFKLTHVATKKDVIYLFFQKEYPFLYL